MPDYIYLMRPLRHEFFDDPTIQEREVMDAHFEYLNQATLQGKIVLAGPCLDETFGVVILRAESNEAAQAFMLGDPAVKNKVMLAELHPLKVSLMAK